MSQIFQALDYWITVSLWVIGLFNICIIFDKKIKKFFLINIQKEKGINLNLELLDKFETAINIKIVIFCIVCIIIDSLIKIHIIG
jgi:hypothetical protein